MLFGVVLLVLLGFGGVALVALLVWLSLRTKKNTEVGGPPRPPSGLPPAP